MATRAEVARTDNSKLGRAVLNFKGTSAPKKEVAPIVSKKKTTKKSSKK